MSEDGVNECHRAVRKYVVKALQPFRSAERLEFPLLSVFVDWS